jgi:acyl-coenzyme A synthetase/AMP-(fatty) acid ligase
LQEPAEEAAVMLLPTSGSTGLPKLTAYTNHGLLAQLMSTWSDHVVVHVTATIILSLVTQ